jgi:hypothetical protein
MERSRELGLLAWQWANYNDVHRDRRNLTAHVLTAPLFMIGTCAVLSGPFTHLTTSVIGAGLMLVAAAAQGRTHRFEAAKPLPFLGPFDVLARLFVEQWVTFPRYVLSGEFARAWRARRS